MQVVVKHVAESDSELPKIESWLSEQHEVLTLVGSSISYDLKSRVSVEETPEKPAFSRYSMILSGKDGKALVVVVVPQGHGEYRITSIKPL